MFAIFLVGASGRVAAQTGTIRGHVVRADSPVGLADAYVELPASGARTRTDTRGFFVFRNVAAGEVAVTVGRLGFSPKRVVLQVHPLSVTEVDIALEPAAINLDPIVTSATRDERSLSAVAADRKSTRLNSSPTRRSSDLTYTRGFFVFRNVAAGEVAVTVGRLGFSPKRVVLQVHPLSVTEVDIALEPAAINLDPIVTSATRDERSLSAVAAAVSVADTSSIRRGPTAGLHETLRMMPGVQVSSRYGTDDANIGIRGSAARARQAVRGVAVLLDGIPLTESDGVARLDLIELAASRQVEVVRGPVSAR